MAKIGGYYYLDSAKSEYRLARKSAAVSKKTVKVFVAGGPEVDKKVNEINRKLAEEYKNLHPKVLQENTSLWIKILNLFGFKK